MSININLPDIGSDEVNVTEILVNIGDNVKQDQSIMTVEGDKASMEIPSPQSGVVKEILIKVGDKVSTNKRVMIFEGAENALEKNEKMAENQVESTIKVEEKNIAVPDIGSDEVQVTEVFIKVGDKINIDQSVIMVEGDKASMEVPSPVAGVIKALQVNVGDKVKTGSPMFIVETSTAATLLKNTNETKNESSELIETREIKSQKENIQTQASYGEFVENDAYAHATPLVRRLAREFDVNLAEIKGSGRKNRILREDVVGYVKAAVKSYKSGVHVSGGGISGLLPWPKIDFAKFGEIETKELTKIQKISGANLHRNWVIIPHVTHFDETDITDVENFRKQQNIEAEKKKMDVKITPLVFLMKAAASALEAYPRFNSSLSDDGQTLIVKKYYNIGVAVDTPNGLVVPVFKDVNKKGVFELSYELANISKKAREGKLTASDMQGGCFTISSLGGIGTTSFTPIINAPEVAILGVSRSSMKPIWNGNEFSPRLMLPLSLSFDHRVIDGADAARFITHLGNTMNDVRRLIM